MTKAIFHKLKNIKVERRRTVARVGASNALSDRRSVINLGALHFPHCRQFVEIKVFLLH